MRLHLFEHGLFKHRLVFQQRDKQNGNHQKNTLLILYARDGKIIARVIGLKDSARAFRTLSVTIVNLAVQHSVVILNVQKTARSYMYCPDLCGTSEHTQPAYCTSVWSETF